MKEKKLNLTVVLGWVVSLICAFIGGSTIDFSPTINSYTEQIDELQEEIKKKDEKIASLTEEIKDKNKNIASLKADCKVTGEKWVYLEDAFPDGPFNSYQYSNWNFQFQGETKKFGFKITDNLKASYKLGKKYYQISFDAYRIDDTQDNRNKDCTLLIYGDDSILFEETFTGDFVSQHYDINVYDVDVLKFIGKDSEHYDHNIGLANMILYY